MALNMNETEIFGDDATDELAGMSPEDIQRRSRLLENEIRVLKVPFHSLILSHRWLSVSRGQGFKFWNGPDCDWVEQYRAGKGLSFKMARDYDWV